MPLARGIMNFGRFTIFQTTTEISSISPNIAICGDTVIFDVTVTNITDSGYIPTGGTITIVNTVNQIVLGTADLIAGVATISTTPGASLGTYIAYYSGVNNLFESSTSGIVNYNIGKNNTTTNMTTIVDTEFCYANTFSIFAHVTAESGPPPSGSVRFRLYSDDINFVELSPGILNTYGDATSAIPPFTTDGYECWIQALYDGYSCWNSSESPPGILGKRVLSIVNNTTTTTTTVHVVGSTTISSHSDITLTADVSSAALSLPSVGSVQFNATDGYTILDLGKEDVVAGSVTLLITSSTIPIGTWDITANYINSSYCYENSLSPSISIIIIE